MAENNSTYNKTNFLLYTGKEGEVKVEVFLQDETLWLTQKAKGTLFGVQSHTITYHLKEIYKSQELEEKSTTRKIRVVQTEGKRNVSCLLDFYNLDAIIVNSYQATQFCIWATKTLKDKGKVSELDAKLKAEQEYEKYRVIQDKNYISDFDNEIKRITGKKDILTDDKSE